MPCYSIDLAFADRMRRRLEDLGVSSESDMVSSTTSELCFDAGVVDIFRVSDDSSWDSSAGSVDIKAGVEIDLELESLFSSDGRVKVAGEIGEL